MGRSQQNQGAHTTTMSIMLSVLVLVTLLFFWRFTSIVNTFENYQHQLAEKQADISVNALQTLTDSIRNRMIAVALDDFFYLELHDFSENISVQEHLQKRLKNYFPEMYSYSLVNTSGEVIGGDIDFNMGEVCRHDARKVAKKLRRKTSSDPYISAIHPVPGAYHFDVMFPVYLNDQSMVFFMSFKSSILYKTLVSQRVSQHSVYVVTKKFPDLIEFSYEGVRDQLKRSTHLSEQELAKVLVRKEIPGTQWTVLVKENATMMDSFKRKQLVDTAMLYLGFLIAWFLISWLIIRQEFKRKRWISRLNFLSFHDPLTGASNRRRLEIVLKNATEAHKTLNVFSGVLYLDLNDFKPINDQYGHAVGDEILKVFVKRLQSCCRSQDEVVRLGGDEFVVVLMDLGQDENAAYLRLTEAAYRCFSIVDDPIEVNIASGKMVTIPVTASIGSLLINQEDMSVDDILKKADEFMYRAKHDIK